MSIHKICVSFGLAAMPFAAHAIGHSLTNGCSIGSPSSQQEVISQQTGQQGTTQQQTAQQDCRPYNQSGTSCAQVGFSEGQSGAPWGQQFGFFVCYDRCLHWAGWAAK